MAEDIARAFDCGFAHHMIKPVNFEHLESALRRITAKDVFKAAPVQVTTRIPKSLLKS